MKAQDEIFICSGITIHDKPVSGLIKALNSADVPMVIDRCLQEVEYNSGSHGKATIPLDWKLGRGGYVTGYVLKNDNLTIKLENHQEYHRGMPGMIGSHLIGSPGVRAKFEYEGHSGIDEMGRAKEVVTIFYSPRLPKSFEGKLKKIIASSRKE